MVFKEWKEEKPAFVVTYSLRNVLLAALFGAIIGGVIGLGVGFVFGRDYGRQEALKLILESAGGIR